MFKFLKLGFLALIMSLFVTACGPNAKPTLDTYIPAFYSGDVDTVMTVIDDYGLGKPERKMAKGKIAGMASAANLEAASRGGFVKYELVELIQDESDKARYTAKVKIFFQDGAIEDSAIKLIERDGKLKISISDK